MVLSSWPWSLQEFTRFIWWMQTERRVAANPQTKPTDLGCESADKWLLLSTSTIAICYYYSARKLILILPSDGGWKAESTWDKQAVHLHCVAPIWHRHCTRDHSIAAAFAANGIGREGGDGSAQRGRSVIYDCLVCGLFVVDKCSDVPEQKAEKSIRVWDGQNWVMNVETVVITYVYTYQREGWLQCFLKFKTILTFNTI